MKLYPQQSLAMITVLAVFSYTTLPEPAAAADAHVVNLSEIRGEMKLSASQRTKNLEDIERVLSLPAAQDSISKARLSKARIRAAIADLNDQELSRLANRARVAEQDVQGGIVVGLLALIGLIVVIAVVVTATRE